MVFPVHAERRTRLGLGAGHDAGRSCLARSESEIATPRRPERTFLRPGPHERDISVGYTTRLSELEQRLRSKRTAAAGPWIELQRRGQLSRLSHRGRSDELSGALL